MVYHLRSGQWLLVVGWGAMGAALYWVHMSSCPPGCSIGVVTCGLSLAGLTSLSVTCQMDTSGDISSLTLYFLIVR